MIQIDKDIPIPVRKRAFIANRKQWPEKYPYREMEVGDSFFIPHDAYNSSASLRTTLYHSARRMGNNYKITIKQVEGGVRCWRIQ